MANPTKADLEKAASQFFQDLAAELNFPRSFDHMNFRDEISFNIEFSEGRIAELETQLIENKFDPEVTRAAELAASKLPIPFSELGASTKIGFLQLIARSKREQMRLFIHQLSSPGEPFSFSDTMFEAPKSIGLQANVAVASGHTTMATAHLADLVDKFITRKELRGLGRSQIDETARSLRWLCEELGPGTAVEKITKDQLRGFRDNLQRLTAWYWSAQPHD